MLKTNVMWSVIGEEVTQDLIDARHWAALWKQVAKEWRRAALEAQEAQLSQVPVIGVLSADTTPDDFERFANGHNQD